MKTKLTIGVVAVFVIGAIWILVAQKGAYDLRTTDPTPVQSTATSTQTTSSTSTSTTSGQKSYTLADVAKHSDQSSCWTTIDSKVYDLTAWISQHPGGEGSILSICGKDGSAAFNAQHGGQRRPASELAMFYIGALVK